MDMRGFEKEKIYPHMPQVSLDYMSHAPYNYTFVKDGKIITCIGVIPLWEGVYEVWQMPSTHIKEGKIEYVKTMRELMLKTAKELKAHRFQSCCPADELHDRWMECMGFECEGLLKEYSRFKEDFKIWARRFEWQ